MECLLDEILLTIFQKIPNVSLLYSLLGVSKRLDQVLRDSTFTKSLTFFEDYSLAHVCFLNDEIMERFCSKIFPRIAPRIEWMNLEICSMERILLSANYPHLSGLGIYDVEEKDLLPFFSGSLLKRSDQTKLNKLISLNI